MVGFEAMDFEERADYARWRSALYGLASRAFLQEPTDEELAEMATAARQALADDCGNATGDAAGRWNLSCEKALLIHLAALNDTEEDLGTRIRSEYAELFIGPRPPLAPLYESMYVGHPRRLLTVVTQQVRDAYERSGLTPAKRNRVPDDHIGYELEFMARLCEHEANAAEAGDAEEEWRWHGAQQRFLADHLARWVEPFCERVEEAPGTYYRGWAVFARDFAIEDERTVNAKNGAPL